MSHPPAARRAQRAHRVQLRSRLPSPAHAAAWATLAALVGCGPAPYEQGLDRDLARASAALAPMPDPATELAAPDFDGSLAGYVDYAARTSPRLRAALEEWRAARLRIEPARRPPEPTLSYGFFARSVETRVGPQRHRLSLRQSLPWPGTLAAGAGAAAAQARAAQTRFDAAALDLTRQVAEVYWQLWLTQETRVVQTEQREILASLAATVRARVEVGQASLADLGQIDLSVSRLDDAVQGLDQAQAALTARLIMIVGAPPGSPAPVQAQPPAPALPAADERALRADAVSHPRVSSFEFMAQSSEAQADRADHARYPNLTVGIDYIETGTAPMPGVADSGKDPIVAVLGLSLPLWSGAYADQAASARAQGQAFRAQGQDARDRAAAELSAALSSLRDAARRIELYQTTLIPQAETVYGSLIAATESSRGQVTAALLAHRDLLELRLGLARAQRDHAVAWATLEHIVGHPVESERMP
ncbi:TolC family protein [Haliangium sp.]|uniref:TolC family protein n=1 Tax=Haliangium sp. TaxID=2663208 RepID=UPI003D0F0025